MALIVLDSQVRSHPKVVKAGGEGAWLWAMAIGYAKDHLTDGFIPDEAMGTLGRFLAPLKKVVAAAVSAGLLDTVAGGYQVHDFHEHNSRADEVRRKRDAKTERQRRWRSRSQVDEVDASTNSLQESLTSVSHAGARPVRETGSQGVRREALNGEEREKPHYGAPIMAGQSSHRSHVACFRVCVPVFIHDEFLRKLPDEQDVADRKLRNWYLEVDEQWQGRAIGDTSEKFWRARFEEWQGTTQKATHRGPSDTWVPKEMREAKS